MAAGLCLLLLPAGCSKPVHYSIGSEGLTARGEMHDRYSDNFELSPGALEPAEQKPQPPEEVPVFSPALIGVGPLVLKEVTLEEGVRQIRTAAAGCPPVVIIPAAVKAAADRRVSLEFAGSVSLEFALTKFLNLLDAGLSYMLQDEALVIIVKGGMEPMAGETK